MFRFKDLLTGFASTVPQSKDQVILESETDYLYIDVDENDTVVRHAIHAPSKAKDTEYDNSSTGLMSTSVQSAIGELLTLIRADPPEITINTETGDMFYSDGYYDMNVDENTGDLMYSSAIYNMQIDNNGDLLYETV